MIEVYEVPRDEEGEFVEEPVLILRRTDRRVAEFDVYLLRIVGVRAYINEERT